MDARELTVSAEYLVTIEAGDDWRAAVEDFAAAEAVTAGWFTGMGTVRDADVWYYDPDDGEHRSVRFDEPLSVDACVGAVSTDGEAGDSEGEGEDDAFARTHAVLSRPSGQALGGHLNAATAVEGAVYLRAFEGTFDWLSGEMERP